MSPRTAYRRKRNPLPEIGAIMLGAPVVAYVTSSIVDRMLEHRISAAEKRGWTFSDDLFPNVAAMERAFGLLNTAPLSAEQESTFR